MQNLSNLEARVAAATHTLAGRKDRVGELENYARRLEAEVHGLNNNFDRLQEELAGAREEISSVAAQKEQLAAENKRLISENSRYRGEFERLENDNGALREEVGRLTRLLDALVDAVEKESTLLPEALQETVTEGEVVEMVRPASANGAESRHNGKSGQQEDIPNEAARRLMDRIRDRIEAQRA